MKKRVFGIFLAACMILALLPLTAAIAIDETAQYTLEVVDPKEGAPNYVGDVITADIYAYATEDTTFGSFQFKLDYDAAKLTLVNVTTTLYGSYQYNNGTLAYTYSGGTGVDVGPTGTRIATATFTVKSGVTTGTTKISLTAAEITKDTNFSADDVKYPSVVGENFKLYGTYAITFTGGNAAEFTPTGGVTDGKATYGTDVTFTMEEKLGYQVTSVQYSVEGGVQNQTLTPENGTYTIPGEDIIGNIAVTAIAASEISVNITGAEVTEGGLVSVELETAEIEGTIAVTLIAARYEGSRMTAVRMDTFDLSSGLTTRRIDLSVGKGDTYKAFLLDAYTKAPLCDAVTITQT